MPFGGAKGIGIRRRVTRMDETDAGSSRRASAAATLIGRRSTGAAVGTLSGFRDGKAIEPMSEPSPPLDIRHPGLTDVLGDVDALSLWELLRRARVPTPAAALVEASDLPLERVHGCLDRLCEAGLVERVKATSRRRAPSWRATRQAIIVGYRVNDPLDEVLTNCLDELFSPERRRWVERHIRPPAADAASAEPSELRFRGAWAGQWGPAERRPFWDLTLELPRLLHASTARFLGAPPSKAQMCTHLIEIHLAPLEPGVPQWPLVRMVPIAPGGGPGGGATSPEPWVLGEPRPTGSRREVAAGLTPREHEVARLIAAGRSRSAIAAALGVSASTVATHAAAVYRKLGVERAEQVRQIVDRRVREAEAARTAEGPETLRGEPVDPAGILDLRLRGLAEVLGDGDALAVWEHLRRLGASRISATSAELAASFEWDRARVDAALRSLASVGPLAVEEGPAAKRRGAGCGDPRWRVAREAIVVGHRIGDAADEAIVAGLGRVHGEDRGRTLRAHAKTFKTRRADEEMYRGAITASLIPEEVQRIREILGSLERHFRAAAAGADGTAASPWCTYRLAVSLEPLLPGILPQPTVQVCGMQRVDDVARSIEERIARLSTRERTVAIALRGGLDRPRIAESLGVSTNTVATLVKRLYAKLGVRSRTELAKRMGM